MHTNFTIYDSTGTIIASGTVPTDILDKQLESYKLRVDPNAQLIEQASDPQKDIVDTVTKTILKNQKPLSPPPVKTYDQNRLELYPKIGEQLDMLWHSMDRGEIPKAEPFYTYIKTIKLAYPKDESAPTDSVAITSVDSLP